jgi:hypothetical protein
LVIDVTRRVAATVEKSDRKYFRLEPQQGSTRDISFKRGWR